MDDVRVVKSRSDCEPSQLGVVFVLNDMTREEDFLGSLWFLLSLSLFRCYKVIHVTLTTSLNNTLKKQTKEAELDTGDDASRRNEKRMTGTKRESEGGWPKDYKLYHSHTVYKGRSHN